jgi:hypothetical protein
MNTLAMNTIEPTDVIDLETALELDALEELLATPALSPDRRGYISAYRYY